MIAIEDRAARVNAMRISVGGFDLFFSCGIGISVLLLLLCSFRMLIRILACL